MTKTIEKKFFTLKEARKLLPDVKKQLSELMKIHRALAIIKEINITYGDEFEAMVNEVERNKEYHALSLKFYQLYQQMLALGVLVKDLSTGLIDFYSSFEGKDIYLCYKYGEEDIAFWHAIQTGFNGRKPVSLLEKKVV